MKSGAFLHTSSVAKFQPNKSKSQPSLLVVVFSPPGSQEITGIVIAIKLLIMMQRNDNLYILQVLVLTILLVHGFEMGSVTILEYVGLNGLKS